MKTATISAGQWVGLLLVSRLATAATFAPAATNQNELWSTLIYGVTWCVLLIPTYLLARSTGGSDVLQTAYHRHKRFGQFVSVLLGVFCLYVISINVLQFIYFVREALSPDMAAAALCVALVATAFWAALYGIESLARTVTPIAVLLVGSIVVVFAMLMPDMKGGYLVETVTADWSSAGWWYDTVRTTEVVVAGLVLSHVNKPRLSASVLWPAVSVSGCLLLIRMTVIGTLGEFALRCFYPYHTAVTAIQVGLISRMDAVVVSIWIAAIFVKTALFAWVFSQSVRSICSPKTRRFVIPAGAMLTAVFGVVFSGESRVVSGDWIMGVSVGGSVLLGVILPLILWIITKGKKRA